MTTKTTGPELADLERAAELIEHFILDGDLSEMYLQKMRLALAEYDPATIVTAVIMLATGAPSYAQIGHAEVVNYVWNVVTEFAKDEPPSATAAEVLDEIERSAG